MSSETSEFIVRFGPVAVYEVCSYDGGAGGARHYEARWADAAGHVHKSGRFAHCPQARTFAQWKAKELSAAGTG